MEDLSFTVPPTALAVPETQPQTWAGRPRWQRGVVAGGGILLTSLALGGCASDETNAAEAKLDSYVATQSLTIPNIDECAQVIKDNRRDGVIDATCEGAGVPKKVENQLISLFNTYSKDKQNDDADTKSKVLNTIMVGAIAITITAGMGIRKILRNPSY